MEALLRVAVLMPQYDPYSDHLYRTYLLATIVGAGLSLIVIVILIWQNTLTRKAANAAKASADAIQNSERAWVIVQSDGQTRFHFFVYGNTPAKIMRQAITSVHVKSIDDLPLVPAYDFSESPHPRVLVAEPERDPWSVRPYFNPLVKNSPEIWQAINEGLKIQVVYGVVVYLDVIDEQIEHETRFCYVWTAESRGFILGGPAAYNRYS